MRAGYCRSSKVSPWIAINDRTQAVGGREAAEGGGSRSEGGAAAPPLGRVGPPAGCEAARSPKDCQKSHLRTSRTSAATSGGRRYAGLVVAALLVIGCHQDEGKLPGESDVPPPGTEESAAGGQQQCEGRAAEGATLFASQSNGWMIVLPGEPWALNCPDSVHASGKMASDKGESLIATVNRVDPISDDDRQHLSAIYSRAQSKLPKAGAKPGPAQLVLARASPKSKQKLVLIYQVNADEFTREGLRSFHGWSIVRTRAGTFECHISATIRTNLDWQQILSEHLSSCLPLKNEEQ